MDVLHVDGKRKGILTQEMAFARHGESVIVWSKRNCDTIIDAPIFAHVRIVLHTINLCPFHLTNLQAQESLANDNNYLNSHHVDAVHGTSSAKTL